MHQQHLGKGATVATRSSFSMRHAREKARCKGALDITIAICWPLTPPASTTDSKTAATSSPYGDADPVGYYNRTLLNIGTKFGRCTNDKQKPQFGSSASMHNHSIYLFEADSAPVMIQANQECGIVDKLLKNAVT